MIKTEVVTAPADEPLDTVTVKLHLRVEADFNDDDILIEHLKKVARIRIEKLTGRKFITQTHKAYYDAFPDGNYFEIPFGKLASVTHLKYTDADGDQSTWDSGNYIVDTVSEPGRLILADGISWPTPSGGLYPSNPIEIQFVCGYGTKAEDVPEPLRQAMLMLITHLYEVREPVIVGQRVTPVPETVHDLMADFRLWDF